MDGKYHEPVMDEKAKEEMKMIKRDNVSALKWGFCLLLVISSFGAANEGFRHIVVYEDSDYGVR